MLDDSCFILDFEFFSSVPIPFVFNIMSNRNNNKNRRVAKRAVSADELLPSRNKIRRTARTLSVDAVSEEPIREHLQSNIISNQPFVRLNRLSENNLSSIVELPNEISSNVDLLPNVQSDAETNHNINNNRRVIFAHRRTINRSESSISVNEQLPIPNNHIREDELNVYDFPESPNEVSSVDFMSNQESNHVDLVSNSVSMENILPNESIENVLSSAPAAVSVPAHHPMIILNRMSEEELNMYDRPDDDDFSESVDNGSQTSTGSQGELLIFTRFEFLDGVRATNIFAQFLFLFELIFFV